MTRQMTILIADDDPEIVRALALRCKKLGLNVVTAANGVEAVIKLKRVVPDLLILDIDMPEADGFMVCERLKDLNVLPLPMIFLTGRSDEDTIHRCEAFGGTHINKGHDTWNNLGPLLRRHIEKFEETDLPTSTPPAVSSQTPESPKGPKILVVDDDPDVTRAIKIRLGYYGVECLEASDGMDAYMLALKERPDVVISDYQMSNGSGDYLIVRLRQHEDTAAIPVIIITGQTDCHGQNVPLERHIRGRLGATAFFSKPVDFDVLVKELGRHIDMSSKSFASQPVAQSHQVA